MVVMWSRHVVAKWLQGSLQKCFQTCGDATWSQKITNLMLTNEIIATMRDRFLLTQNMEQTPSTIGELSCNSNVEPWIMGVTINSVSTRRQAGAEYLLLDSGAQLHACPIKYPGQKVPLLDPGIHTASGARLQHDGGRLVTYKLPEGRTIRVLFHACAVQKPNLSLGCLPQQGGVLE